MPVQYTPTLQPVQTNPNVAWSNSWLSVSNSLARPFFAQAVFETNVNSTGSQYIEFGKRNKSVVGPAKVSLSQNIYEADFEYGLQPLRWEVFTSSNYNTATVKHAPGMGGVVMQILSGGDVTIRQSRPYHRYQPGKSMFMATATNYGGPYNGQYQRVGFFDDANGMFFEQGNVASTYNSSTSAFGVSNIAAIPSSVYTTSGVNYTGLNASLSANNPYGMYICWRSDINSYAYTGVPSTSIYTDYKISLDQWSDPCGVAKTINWTQNQMLWMEYSWYGAGCLRWGVLLGGEPYILHEQTMGNLQQFAWSRTGNLPVRYEQRDTTFTNTSALFMHYGVSVLVEGQRDPQRGFTYAYGNSATVPVPANKNQIPLMSIRPRTMGTIEYSSTYFAPVTSYPAPTTSFMAFSGANWANNQLVGRAIYFPTLSSIQHPNGFTAKISANSPNALYLCDVVTLSAMPFTPYANIPYQIGLIDRGQILPQDMFITSNANALVQLIASTPSNPITLTNAKFQPLSASGSTYSFAELDLNATSVTGGEVVYAFLTPSAGTVQDVNLQNFFPLYNNIRGNTPDILTVAITTTTQPVTAGVHLVAQEAMS